MMCQTLDLRIHFKVVPSPTLSELLRQRREAAGLSQVELAHRLGIKQQQVSKWESGTATPGTRRLPDLARALDIDKGELLELVADASQAETANIRRDRDHLQQLVRRFERFAEKYEELGHTYESNNQMLVRLSEKLDTATTLGREFGAQVEAILAMLANQDGRLTALEQRAAPPGGGPPPSAGRRTGRR